MGKAVSGSVLIVLALFMLLGFFSGGSRRGRLVLGACARHYAEHRQ